MLEQEIARSRACGACCYQCRPCSLARTGAAFSAGVGGCGVGVEHLLLLAVLRAPPPPFCSRGRCAASSRCAAHVLDGGQCSLPASTA